MRTIVPVIILAVLSASAASAQQSRDGKPAKPAKSLPLRPPKAATNPCAEYGAGFARLEGSSTCIKIGGSIGVGAGMGVGTAR
jgi:hypothetical protein